VFATTTLTKTDISGQNGRAVQESMITCARRVNRHAFVYIDGLIGPFNNLTSSTSAAPKRAAKEAIAMEIEVHEVEDLKATTHMT
jgi:hypothetical protein